MYTFHTREFVSILDIDDWLNSFYDLTLSNCQQNVEIVKYEFTPQFAHILITIRVFKDKTND